MSHLASATWRVSWWCSHFIEVGIPSRVLGALRCVGVPGSLSVSVLSLPLLLSCRFSCFCLLVLSEPGPGVVVDVFVVYSWSLVLPGVVLLGAPGSARCGVLAVYCLLSVVCCLLLLSATAAVLYVLVHSPSIISPLHLLSSGVPKRIRQFNMECSRPLQFKLYLYWWWCSLVNVYLHWWWCSLIKL